MSQLVFTVQNFIDVAATAQITFATISVIILIPALIETSLHGRTRVTKNQPDLTRSDRVKSIKVNQSCIYRCTE